MNKKTMTTGQLLAKINSPEELRALSTEQLTVLADELRDFILDVTSVNPGHLGSSLGVVELTIALHYVFNTPYDKLIWDVGHQSYSHKILTGRRDRFHTLRRKGGISGFPSREESPYDAFGTGHASTAVSAALGMAMASKLRGEPDKQHIAVMGDGALTGGMAMEALNNAGDTNANIIVVLNDNGISIDKNRGVLKDNFVKTKLFESFNFKYTGPVDGHDIPLLLEKLEEVKRQSGPRLLHVITTKGKGFKKAEKEQTLYHAPGKFDRITGEIEKKVSHHTYQEVYGKTLLELARGDDRIVAVTPAMPSGSALTYMAGKYPERVFDVGIAEQHAVTFAAGLAAGGLKPFCTVYSTFLQRAYDQLIHDVALQRLPVVFGIDRAGIVGADGATHHGFFDLSVLNSIPGIVVAAPMNEAELRRMIVTAADFCDGPFAIRYPRSQGVLEHWEVPLHKMEIGKGRVVKPGNGDVAFVVLGHAGNNALKAVDLLSDEIPDTALYDMRFLKPIDNLLLNRIFSTHKIIITVEDGMIQGGFGMTVKALAQNRFPDLIIENRGIPDRFIKHGTPDELYAECGFDAQNLAGVARKLLKKIS